MTGDEPEVVRPRDSDPAIDDDDDDFLLRNDLVELLDRDCSFGCYLISSCSLRSSLSSRCDGVCTLCTPDIESWGSVLIVIFVAVAVQQPYAMRWSMTNAVSPAAVALGNNVQKRSVSRCSSLNGFRDVAMKSCDWRHGEGGSLDVY